MPNLSQDSLPLLILWLSEQRGKSASKFTKDDWRWAAITAAKFFDSKVKIPGKQGRKKKRRGVPLSHLVNPPPPRLAKKKIGRPRQQYGENGVDISVIASVMDDLLSGEIGRRWRRHASRTQKEAVELVLAAIGHPYPAGYAESVLRSLRTYRKQSKNKK